MKVNNVNGTSPNSCKCGSWLKHWLNFSGQKLPLSCAEIACASSPECGAHVQKDGAADRSWYILPLCTSHNKTAESLSVLSSIALVSASRAFTCEG